MKGVVRRALASQRARLSTALFFLLALALWALLPGGAPFAQTHSSGITAAGRNSEDTPKKSSQSTQAATPDALSGSFSFAAASFRQAPRSQDTHKIELISIPPLAEPGKKFPLLVAVQSSLAAAQLEVGVHIASRVTTRSAFLLATAQSPAPPPQVTIPVITQQIFASQTDTTSPGLVSSPSPEEEKPRAGSPAAENPEETQALSLYTATFSPLVVNDGAHSSRSLILSEDGVYPLSLTLRNKHTNKTLATATTFAVRLEKKAASPFGLAWIWPLQSLLPTTPDDTKTLLSDLTSEGRLAGLTRAAESSDLPLTLWPIAETIERARAHENIPLIARWLQTLPDLGAKHEILGGSFTHMDADAHPIWHLLRNEQQNYGTIHTEKILIQNFHAQPVQNIRVVSAEGISPEALFFLADTGVHTAVVAPHAVSTVDTDILRTSLTQAFAFSDESRLRGIRTDPFLLGDLNETEGGPVAAAQRLLADLTILHLERPSEKRGAVILSPSDWSPSKTFLEEAAFRINSVAHLHAQYLSGFVESLPFQQVKQGRQVHALTLPLTPSSPSLEKRKEQYDLISETLQELHRLYEMLCVLPGTAGCPRQQPLPKEFQGVFEQVLRATDQRIISNGGTSAYIAPIRARINNLYSGIYIPEDVDLTLTSREGEIPISIQNNTGYSVRLLVTLDSAPLEFENKKHGETKKVTVPSGNFTTTFHVKAPSRGKYVLDLKIASAANPPYTLLQRSLHITSTTVNTVAVALSLLSLIILAFWWTIDARRRRHQRNTPQLRHARGNRRSTSQKNTTQKTTEPATHNTSKDTVSDLALSHLQSAETRKMIIPPGLLQSVPPDIQQSHSEWAPDTNQPNSHFRTRDETGDQKNISEHNETTETTKTTETAKPTKSDDSPPLTDSPPAPAPAGTDRLLKASGILALGTLLSRITGLGRTAALAYALGLGVISNSYNYANTAPNQIYELALGGVLTSVLVPIFVEELNRSHKEDGQRMISTLFCLGLSIAVMASALLSFAAPFILDISGPDLTEEEHKIGVDFLRFFGPQIFFYALNALSSGLLQAQRRFTVPAFAPVLNNLTVIASFIVFAQRTTETNGTLSQGNLALLALGTTGGVAAMAIVSTLPLILRGEGLRPRFAFRAPIVTKLLRLSGWTVAFVVTNQIGLIVIQRLLSSDESAYAAWNYAFIFFQLPNGIVAVSVMTALLPALSEHASVGNHEQFAARLIGGLRLIAFLMLPATIGYLFLSDQIITLALQWGSFGTADTSVVAELLRFFSLGLLPFTFFMLLLRSFYATQDTRTPFFVNLIARAAAITGYLLVYPTFGATGLAFVYGFSFLLASIIGVIVLSRRLGTLHLAQQWPVVQKMLLAGSMMSLGLFVATKTLFHASSPAGALVEISGGVVLSGLLYFGTAALLGVEETWEFWRLVRRTPPRPKKAQSSSPPQ